MVFNHSIIEKENASLAHDTVEKNNWVDEGRSKICLFKQLEFFSTISNLDEI